MTTNLTKNIGEQNHKKRTRFSIYINLLTVLIVFAFVICLEQLKDHANYPEIALAATILVVIISLVLFYAWYRSLDEFEKQLIDKSCLIAFYAGFVITMPWSVMHRFGFTNVELEAHYLLLIMAVVSTLYYYGMKFIAR